MKFYKVEEQLNNLYWKHVAYFKKKEDAEKYVEQHNTKVIVKPIRINECSFSKLSDFLN